MKSCLTKLGLKVNQDSSSVPSLSRLHLSSSKASNLSDITESLSEVITTDGDDQLIKAENDTFLMEQDGTWSVSNLKKVLPAAVQNVIGAGETSTGTQEESTTEENKMVDYDQVVKRLVIHNSNLPESKETPYFNHNAFFANLEHMSVRNKNTAQTFGRTLMYGEVVTSTNTLLEKSGSFSSQVIHFANSSQEPLATRSPTAGDDCYCDYTSRRPWPRLECLGLATRLPDVQHRDPPPALSQHRRPSRICPIPSSTRNHLWHPLLRQRLREAPRPPEMAQRHLRS